MIRARYGRLVPPLALAATLVTSIAGGDEVNGTFCPILSIVRAVAASDFASISGAQQQPGVWAATVTLPEFTRCVVRKDGGGAFHYVCESSPTEDAEVSRQALWRIAGEVSSCSNAALQLVGENGRGDVANFVASDHLGYVDVNLIKLFATDSEAGNIVKRAFRTELTVHATATRVGQIEGRPLLVATPQPSGPHKPVENPLEVPSAANFCPKLTRVVTEADKRFAGIRARGSELSGWDTDLKLAGVSHCRIDPLGVAFYYNCRVSSHTDRSASDADLGNFQTLVGGCLGEAWDQEVTRSSTLTSPEKTISYWKGDFYPTVELRQRAPTVSSDEWQIDFQVKMPRNSQ